MEAKVLDEHFGKQTVNLNLIQKLQLKILGHAYLFHATKNGWKGKLPFYIVKCKKHNIFFIDYPHGFPPNQYFNCPLCLKEMTKKFKGEHEENQRDDQHESSTRREMNEK